MTYADTVSGEATDVPEDRPAVAPRRRVPRRLLFWRSPEGQPAWARPVLLGIAALAAVVYAWNIRDSGFALFYSVAVKSMSVSWKAFFYGALDPGATITIDKLAGSFVPQALSARIFGYHAWSLTLPQVIEGVVAVLAMYRIGRRWQGPAVGLLAAGLFALTPIISSMFGHPMEDGMLTMALVLAGDAFQRAMLEARLRSLILAGVWVGVGFQAKMLQAWMVLPAMAITYLVVAPAGFRRRLAQLSVAGAVLIAVSLSWILLYTATPAADRPYVDGSTNNNAFSMVFGYNGLDRFGISIPGSVQSMFTQAANSSGPPTGFNGAPGGNGGGPANFQPPAGGGAPGGGGPGGDGQWTKLLSGRYVTQIGWLYPLVLLSLGFGLIARGRRPRTDPIRAGFLFWGLWLTTYAVIFSKIMIPHTAYMASLAPPIAALAAGGIVLARRTWMLPLMVLTELAWTLYLVRGYTDFLPWLSYAVVALGAVALVILVLGKVSGRVPTKVFVAALTAGVVAMVATPAAWALSVVDSQYAGSAFDASAGPALTRGAGPGVIRGLDVSGAQFRGGGPGGFGSDQQADALTGDQYKLYSYLRANRGGAKFIAAVQGWNSAAPFITATGQAFLPMGGFSGTVPSPTLSTVQGLVRRGQLRYFLLGGGGGFSGGGAGAGDSELTRIVSWVQSGCTAVPASDYGGSTDQSGGFSFGGAQQLYRCPA